MRIILVFLMVFFLNFNSFAFEAGEKIDFSLAKIDGSRFVSSQEFEGLKTIIIFFDIDCLPCVKKINYINENIDKFYNVNIVVINLIDEKVRKNQIINFELNEKIVFLQAPKNPKIFLRKFGNNSGALPFLALISNNGIFCMNKTEMFSDDDLKKCDR